MFATVAPSTAEMWAQLEGVLKPDYVSESHRQVPVDARVSWGIDGVHGCDASLDSTPRNCLSAATATGGIRDLRCRMSSLREREIEHAAAELHGAALFPVA